MEFVPRVQLPRAQPKSDMQLHEGYKPYTLDAHDAVNLYHILVWPVIANYDVNSTNDKLQLRDKADEEVWKSMRPQELDFTICRPSPDAIIVMEMDWVAQGHFWW